MGLSIGMGALEAMPDATTCVTEGGSLVTDVSALINKIKKNPSDIMNIIKQIEKLSVEVT